MSDPPSSIKKLKDKCHGTCDRLIAVPKGVLLEVINYAEAAHAEYRKNFKLLCATEEELARERMRGKKT